MNAKYSKNYPPSKNEGDMYNRAYFYLRYHSIPEGVSQKGFKDFKKHVSDHYQLVKESKNIYTLSRLQFQSKNSKIKYTIPYKKDIPQIIKVAHGMYEESVIKHNGISTTVKKILSFGINWCLMDHDVRKFINCCKQCINQSSDKPCNTPKIIEPSWQ